MTTDAPTNRTQDELAEAMYGASAERPAAQPLMADTGAPRAETTTNRTQDELAEAMYGNAGQARRIATPSSDQPIESRSQDELAAAIYDREPDAPLESVSEELQAVRDDPARRMYNPDATFAKIVTDKGYEEYFPPKEARKVAREFRAMLADVDFSTDEAAQLKTITERYRTNPPDPKVQQAAAREALRNEFGADHEQALADAKQLVRRDPRWARMLTHSGLGDDPQVVLMFARKARAMRSAGKIK